MQQLIHIESIEKRLWSTADSLRSNSNLASNEYFLPVMGIIFLRHAFSRFLKARENIEKNLPKRGGKTRELTKEDFSQSGALFLQEKSYYSYLVESKTGERLSERIINAMDLIETDYPELLKGTLPKEEYSKIDDTILSTILKNFYSSDLQNVDGDIFGRIYEYFLAQFANLAAHDNGEFLTPQSLVQLIVSVIEPDQGTVLDPACGSGGMFVQSAHFVERKEKHPGKLLTFKGQEKNETTIRLAKMNLAVHGLEGIIHQGITYYEDKHDLLGKADYVMANPPFNVDEIDAEKIKNNPRTPFGLPSVNNKKKVTNGNYIWIQYFYSYLNEKGRAGFVMSSQASSSGRLSKEEDKKKDEYNSSDEAGIRKALVESGHVDVMISIRSNFFYTRSVPCELWFFDKSKPIDRLDTVLMIDARNIYRKVTRKINDFSPEQIQNISSIVWLYRKEEYKFLELVDSYHKKALEPSVTETSIQIQSTYKEILSILHKFADKEKIQYKSLDSYKNLIHTEKILFSGIEELIFKLKKNKEKNKELSIRNLHLIQEKLKPISESCEDLNKDLEMFIKLLEKYPDSLKEQLDKDNKNIPPYKDTNKFLEKINEGKISLSEQLNHIQYYTKQANWLLVHFPDGKLVDVEGLVKVVTKKELKNNDYSLTPGRYVGVSPEEEDEYDFKEKLNEIHIELSDLNREAVLLAQQIQQNFESLL